MHDRLSALMHKAPKMLSSDIQAVLLEEYDTAYGIYNHDHDDPTRPFASVAMHWQESPFVGGPLYERIIQFEQRKVAARFNISLPEFLSLPPHVVRFILRYSKEETEKELRDNGPLMEQLKRMLQGADKHGKAN